MINSVLIIGCGGIGQYLIPAAVKLLQYHPNGTLDITIVDGDYYESNNKARQFVTFDGDNKARALAQSLPYYVKTIPKFINNSNVYSILSELTPPMLIIPCVDNLATRYILLKNLDMLNCNYYWLCPGNEYETYQVSFYTNTGEIEGGFSHPFKRYINLANPDDKLPGSCMEETPSTPQLIAANINAASTAISYLTNILDQKPIPQEVIGNIRQLKHEAIGVSKLWQVKLE